MHNLGACLMNATEPLRDLEKARHWFLKAAALEVGLSMVSLSKIYEHGQGVESDQLMASQWREQALASEDPVALKALDAGT